MAGLAVAEEADFLAYGDMRGYLEPCGCDPLTDLGGIRRINSQLRREFLTFPNALVLNLGNNLSFRKEYIIKNKFLLRAEETNKPDAYLINILELQNVADYSAYKLPFLLSNARTRNLGRQHLETKEALIFGYTWSDAVAGQVEKISDQMLVSWRKLIDRKKSKHTVLLFSGPDTDLNLVIKANLFTQIISGNKRPLTEDPGKEEAENEALLVRIAEPLIFMVPSGGQGILRGGSLTFMEAKTLDGYLKNDEKICDKTKLILPLNCKDPVGLLFGKKNIRVTWLKKEAEPGHVLANLYSAYNQEISAEFRVKGKVRLLALKTSPFAGNQACVQCHQSQHAVYSQSRHARAMQTLIAKGKHEDPECVACHSLASNSLGGFVSVADSPQLANVQCENCHGPRKEHIANPASKKSIAVAGESTCTTCHNRQHSPGFVFANYWEKIKH